MRNDYYEEAVEAAMDLSNDHNMTKSERREALRDLIGEIDALLDSLD
jgi:hypothetical protein